MATFEKLPQKKLRDVLGQSITIEKIVELTGNYGPYVLLVTKTESIISGHKRIMEKVAELKANLPVTVTVKKELNGQFDQFILE